jgi:DNA-binding MarR family transcriptional regulator
VLEQEGLVQRIPGVQDKRIQFVELTKAGYLAIARWLAHRVRA